MKTLAQHINEWKVNSQSVENIHYQKHHKYFIYEINNDGGIRVFDYEWPILNDYRNNVYIDGEHIEINGTGFTTGKEFKRGEHYVLIKDIDKIDNCSFMFDGCHALKAVPIFNTSKVKDMMCMFRDCRNLEEVPLLNTKNVTNMYGMFCYCKKIKSIPNFNVYNVNDMQYMFQMCETLKDVPLFNINKNVKMLNMFLDCYELNENTIDKWSKKYDFNNDCEV